MPVYVRSSSMPVSATVLSDWHFHAGALDRLTPPWQDVRILQRPAALADGAIVKVEVRMLGMRCEWVARHVNAQPGVGFTDIQDRGPFARWEHRHTFLPRGTDGSTLEDRIDYEVPGGFAGRALLAGRAARELERLFTWRHRRTRNDLQAHAPFAGERLRVAISGTTGMVGGALVPYLTTAGHDVRRIVRGAADPAHGDIAWNQQAGTFDTRALEGLDAVVHLAGAGIADARWTDARKEVLRASRVDSTHALARALASLKAPPRVLVCASAIGYYGSRAPGEELTEESAPGDGFLPELCRAWEAAAQPAVDAGIRVVHLRIGAVISARGGVLARLLTPFRLGLGGPVGNGRQVMSWVALDDLLGITRFAMSHSVAGAVNAVSPHAVTNRVFARTLGNVLGRPAVTPMLEKVVTTMFGEMGRELLLGGSRVVPARLAQMHYPWVHPRLEGAMRFETGNFAAPAAPAARDADDA